MGQLAGPEAEQLPSSGKGSLTLAEIRVRIAQLKRMRVAQQISCSGCLRRIVAGQPQLGSYHRECSPEYLAAQREERISAMWSKALQEQLSDSRELVRMAEADMRGCERDTLALHASRRLWMMLEMLCWFLAGVFVGMTMPFK